MSLKSEMQNYVVTDEEAVTYTLDPTRQVSAYLDLGSVEITIMKESDGSQTFVIKPASSNAAVIPAASFVTSV